MTMTNAEELSPKQKEVFDFIRESLEESSRPPTLRELAKRLGVGVSTVQDHVAALESKGFVKREQGQSRSFSLTNRAGAAHGLSLPLLGAVPAGAPREAIENADERFSLDRSVAAKADYVLRVKGDSMEPEILDGDLVLVKKAEAAESGEIVVAHVADAEATVKRLRRRGRSVFLEPANPKYDPITKAFRVIGKVVGMVRSYGK